VKILVSYRGIPQSPGWATGDLVVKALRALGHEVFPYAKYYQQSKWVEDRKFALDDHVFDLILYMECNDGDPQYHELQLVRARTTACWLFDTSYHQDRYKRLVDYFRFDHLFLANPLTIQEYKVWGYNNAHYLPYACDRELHGRPLEYPKTRDVVLVGSIRDDRIDLANQLKQHGVELELVSEVFREDYIDALASAKIVINQNPTEGRGLLNMRHFEAQAAGTFLLEQNIDSTLNISLGQMHYRANFYPCEVKEIPKICNDVLESWEDQPTPEMSMRRNDFFDHHTYHSRCEQLLKTVFPYESN
jgi:hypothetical protein